jgi:hypothetical protein
MDGETFMALFDQPSGLRNKIDQLERDLEDTSCRCMNKDLAMTRMAGEIEELKKQSPPVLTRALWIAATRLDELVEGQHNDLETQIVYDGLIAEARAALDAGEEG